MRKRILSVSNLEDKSHIVNLSLPELGLSDRAPGARVSPIYNLGTGSISEKLLNSGECFVLFLYIPTIFRHLDALASNNELMEQLWISNGLANLILITERKELVDELKQTFIDLAAVTAFEEWAVSDSKLMSNSWETINTGSELSSLEFEAPVLSTDETRFLENEFYSGISVLLNKSAIFLPASLKHFEKNAKKGKGIIGKIAAIESGNSENLEEKLSPYINDLVEINSVLSYALSQGFSATPPILNTPAVINSYALLGIGSNYLSYLALYIHVHSVFRTYSVESIICQQYKNEDGFSIFSTSRNSLAHRVGVSSEDDEDVVYDERLVYFSGRLGFRESQNSISSSVFCLTKSSTNKWNLLYFTHEYTHAHVSKIFSPDPISNSEGTEAYIKELVGKYNVYIKTKPEDIAQNFTKLECLGFAIFHYFKVVEAFESRQKSAEQEESTVPFDIFSEINSEAILTFWRGGARWSMLNEIIVHALDYHYFYNGRKDVYVSVLWESWSTVPQVKGDLHNYILRTLISLSSTTSPIDTIAETNKAKRFDMVVESFNNELRNIAESSSETELVLSAIEFLENTRNKARLKASWVPSINLIDTVMATLHHPNIHAELVDDILANSSGEYPIGRGDLTTGSSITSPVGFLQHNSRQELALRGQVDVSDLQDEFLSIWSSFACGSSLQ
jgi:hypothetical protein